MHRGCRGAIFTSQPQAEPESGPRSAPPPPHRQPVDKWNFLMISFSQDLPFHTRSAPPQARPPIPHHSVNKVKFSLENSKEICPPLQDQAFSSPHLLPASLYWKPRNCRLFLYT